MSEQVASEALVTVPHRDTGVTKKPFNLRPASVLMRAGRPDPHVPPAETDVSVVSSVQRPLFPALWRAVALTSGVLRASCMLSHSHSASSHLSRHCPTAWGLLSRSEGQFIIL